MSPTYLSPACVLCTVDHNGRHFYLCGYNDEQIIWVRASDSILVSHAARTAYLRSFDSIYTINPPGHP